MNSWSGYWYNVFSRISFQVIPLLLQQPIKHVDLIMCRVNFKVLRFFISNLFADMTDLDTEVSNLPSQV